MKKVLICSIIRNQASNLNLWFNQLKSLVEYVSDQYECYLSVFENDSTDGTQNLLKNFNFSFCKDFTIECCTFNSTQYGSVWSIDRIKNLAFYRQSCIDNAFKNFTDIYFDKICYIEPDIEYDPAWSKELILAKHPELAGINPDIYSAWSLRSNQIPKESMYLYDTCAVRQTKDDLCWNFDTEKDWINSSLIKTHISTNDSYCLHSVYSTFNCFCVYKSDLFYKGLRWHYTNDRINPSDIQLEENLFLDSDTVNIVENFRKNGYNQVLLNRNCITRHL